MRIKKFSKVVLTWAMRIAVFILFGPFAFLYYWILRCELAIQIRRLRGKRSDERLQSSIGKLGSGRVVTMKEVSDAEMLDFKTHRSLTYIKQITYGSLWEISDLASCRQKVPLISNFVLRHVLQNSAFSHGLVKENDTSSEIAWRFCFDDLGTYQILQERSWDVAEIWILKSDQLKILDRTGKIHSARCKTWPLAKAHAQVQLTLSAPGLAHNHIQFTLPALMACEVHQKLPETSILRQLLEPHTRFTQYVNYQALREYASGPKTGNLYDRVLRPWLRRPVDKSDFANSVQKKCAKYYAEKYSLVPNFDEDLAYQAFLGTYYVIFRNFISELAPLLKTDYEIVSPALAEHLPAIGHESMVDVLTGLLWNSAVVHYCDHESFMRQWGRRYGCNSVCVPLVKPEPKIKLKETIKTISDGKINKAFIPDAGLPTDKNANPVDVDIVIEGHRYSVEDGSKFFSSLGVCRTRCFMRTFVQFNESTTVKMKLLETEYNFSDPAASKAAANFMTEMKDLNSLLQQRGEGIVNGEDFIRSVCF